MADTPNQTGEEIQVAAAVQGVLGAFYLAELQSALATFTQDYGPVDDSQYVDIMLLGPIDGRAAVLSPIEVVPAVDATDPTSFLLTDLTNALNAFVQDSGQAAGSIVNIVIKLPTEGWGDPKTSTP